MPMSSSFDNLLGGFQRFHENDYRTQRARWAGLEEKQTPSVLVIACSDSRVDPAQIFDTSPGEIFVVRNVANLVPPYENDSGRHGVSAALEYAVTQIPVAEVLVLGHELCGGCKASMSQAFRGAAPGSGGFVAHWIDMLDSARTKVMADHGHGDQAHRALEREAVKVSIANLRTFPFVAEAEAAGRLRLRGAWFSIRKGILKVLDEKTGKFNTVPTSTPMSPSMSPFVSPSQSPAMPIPSSLLSSDG